MIVEDGEKLPRVTQALWARDDIYVVGPFSDPTRFSGIHGEENFNRRILVAPKTGIDTLTDLNAFADRLMRSITRIRGDYQMDATFSEWGIYWLGRLSFNEKLRVLEGKKITRREFIETRVDIYPRADLLEVAVNGRILQSTTKGKRWDWSDTGIKPPFEEMVRVISNQGMVRREVWRNELGYAAPLNFARNCGYFPVRIP